MLQWQPALMRHHRKDEMPSERQGLPRLPCSQADKSCSMQTTFACHCQGHKGNTSEGK